MSNERKVALVTGAASGIGAAVAVALESAGYRVVAADIASPTAPVSSAESAIRYVHLDVANESHWQKVIGEMTTREGRLDLLANVAGILESGGIETVTPAALMRILDVNTKGVFIGCREAIRVMKAQAHDAAIVNVASANAVKAQSWTSAYAASKAAVVSLTRTTALHCAENGYPIRVNAVLPGIVRTPMVERLLAAQADPAAAAEGLAAYHPIKRLLAAEEIAAVVLFLASPAASAVTGACIAADGGMTAG